MELKQYERIFSDDITPTTPSRCQTILSDGKRAVAVVSRLATKLVVPTAAGVGVAAFFLHMQPDLNHSLWKQLTIGNLSSLAALSLAYLLIDAGWTYWDYRRLHMDEYFQSESLATQFKRWGLRHLMCDPLPLMGALVLLFFIDEIIKLAAQQSGIKVDLLISMAFVFLATSGALLTTNALQNRFCNRAEAVSVEIDRASHFTYVPPAQGIISKFFCACCRRSEELAIPLPSAFSANFDG